MILIFIGGTPEAKVAGRSQPRPEMSDAPRDPEQSHFRVVSATVAFPDGCCGPRTNTLMKRVNLPDSLAAPLSAEGAEWTSHPVVEAMEVEDRA
jgi:hypothetical protein